MFTVFPGVLGALVPACIAALLDRSYGVRFPSRANPMPALTTPAVEGAAPRARPLQATGLCRFGDEVVHSAPPYDSRTARPDLLRPVRVRAAARLARGRR